MNKKIIICSDGTWNTPDQKENNQPVPTNVIKLVRALKPQNSEGINQVVFYDQGVGTTGGPIVNFVGGITGWGISANILDCYRFLANNYQPGDEVYCFGFSRGAYTVRAFAGLVAGFGLLAKPDLDELPKVYALSRIPPADRPQHKLYPEVQALNARSIKPRIKLMGVWDTVGALGVPTPLLGWISRKLWVGFHDTQLRNTDYAYQALAVDERRKPFRPAVWTEAPDITEIKQVWFSGAHANVGGGYLDEGLSDIAFDWMIKMATVRGLEFEQRYLDDTDKVHPDERGELINSFSLPYRLFGPLFKLGPYLRPIGREHDDPKGKKTGFNEMMHQSVANRHAADLLSYNPENNDFGLKNLPIEPY